MDEKDCTTCKKNNKGDNWRDCRLKCHYKYEQMEKDEIYKLKEEKEQLQKRFNDYQDKKIEENANLMKRLDIADKKLTVFSRELEQANKENERLRKINHELAEEHKTIGQDLYAEIKDYRKEKENLKQQLEIDKNQINYFIEENEKQKEQIKQLEDFIKSDGEIDNINHEYTYKLKKVLQEVKSIAKGVRGYLEVPAPRDVRFEMDRILDLITETELPDQKERAK